MSPISPSSPALSTNASNQNVQTNQSAVAVPDNATEQSPTHLSTASATQRSVHQKTDGDLQPSAASASKTLLSTGDIVPFKFTSTSIKRWVFSPDGQWLVACDSKNILRLLHARGHCTMKEIGETVDNGRIVFSPDGKLVAWSATEGKISYRPLAAQGCTKQFDYEVNGGFTFSADSQFLMVPELDSASEEELTARSAAREQELIALRDGSREIERQQETASARQSDIVLVTSLCGLVGCVVLGPSGAVGLPFMLSVKLPMFLSNVGKWGTNWWIRKLEEQKEQLEQRIHTGYLKTKIQFLPLQANAKPSAVEIFTDVPISSIAFSADRKHCITAEGFKVIKRNLETGKLEGKPINLSTYITYMASSPNGKWWAIEGIFNNVLLVSSETQEVKSRFFIDRDQENEMIFSSDEKWLAIIERDGLLTLISTDSGKRTINKGSFGGFYAIWWSKTEEDTLIGMGKDNVLRKLRIVATEEVELHAIENLLQMNVTHLNSEIETFKVALKAAMYNMRAGAGSSITHESSSPFLIAQDFCDSFGFDSEYSEEEQLILLQAKLHIFQAKLK